MAPKEATIYYLLGKIYKRLKQPDKAMTYFTTALDLDSKSSNLNYIKSAIDKLHMPDAEDEEFELN
jgi:anaphase-promoting complex subunit 3